MTTEALTRVDPAGFPMYRDAIAALEAIARAADGHDSLGEGIWRDLAHPDPESVGYFLESRAYMHVARAEGEHRNTHWTAGVVRVPDGRDERTTTSLLEAAVAHVTEHGGGTITCWVFGAADADDPAFATVEFESARTLVEMRAPLPVGEAPRWPAGIEVRTYDPDRDAEAWLRVNNRAFAGHAEQGGWTGDTRDAHMSETWFDPELFLLVFDAGGLAGFNWLKQHDARGADPALGEIYVIGVDPRAQGTGLGRALAIAGLQALHDHGSVAAMLFCAADNAGALALYRSLGFVVRRTDRAYERSVPVA